METLFGDDTAAFQVVQPLAKGAWVYTSDGLFQFAKPFWAANQVAQYKGGPFVADYFHGTCYTADVRFEWFYRGGVS